MALLLPVKQKICWPDDSYFFLTSSTFLHYPYFKEDQQKRIVLDKIKEIEKSLKISIPTFSISINHFHLLFYLKLGSLMTKIKTILHSGIARDYRKIYQVQYKDFWQSTKTIFVKNEIMFWKLTGYTIGNLLKHKEVSTFEELKANQFSSYALTAEKFGEETARDLVYSVINVDENTEGVVDIKKIKEVKVGPLPWAG